MASSLSEVSTNIDYNTDCAQTITTKSRSNFSSAFFFLEKPKRVAIQNVYAFFRLIDDAVDEEPSLEKQKKQLRFWRGQLTKIKTGSSDILVMNQLKHSIQAYKIPYHHFEDLIDGCWMDLEKKRYQSFADLYEYCFRVASTVGLVCMCIFEYQSVTAKQMAIDLGLALQLTNIIRDVGVDAQKGRIYLPQEDLDRFSVSSEGILAQKKDAGFDDLMDFQFERARNYFLKAAPEFLKDKSKKLRAALIMGQVYWEILRKIKKQGYPVLDRKVGLSFSQKLSILGRVFLSHRLRL